MLPSLQVHHVVHGLARKFISPFVEGTWPPLDRLGRAFVVCSICNSTTNMTNRPFAGGTEVRMPDGTCAASDACKCSTVHDIFQRPFWLQNGNVGRHNGELRSIFHFLDRKGHPVNTQAKRILGVSIISPFVLSPANLSV